jgi:choline dehydrogenase
MTSRRRFLQGAAALTGALWSRQGKAQAVRSDYVIVGAGSSGCVLANRLSRDPQVRVLVVEAGGPETLPLIATPGQWTSLLGTGLDWAYRTAADPGLAGRSIAWPRGKSYGGSSSIGAMAYVRGHALSFDEWAREGGPAWRLAELLPLFRRVERNSRGASDYHGDRGDQAVSDTTDPHAGHLSFLDAARANGFAARPDWDFNGAQQEQGAGFYQKTILNGRRHSAAAAFLVPALDRPNLTVWPHTIARRVVVRGHRAVGVEVQRGGGAPEVVVADRGVIIAAGAVESPKLLMLSGIGPADDLRRHGLGVIADLPGVGANLQDHPRVPVRWTARTPLAPSSVSAGLLTSSSVAGAGRAPDLQFYVGRGLDAPDPFITLTVTLASPRSRGRLALASADPLAAPVIHPGYFAEPADLDALIEGVRLARALGEDRAFARIRGGAVDPPERDRAAPSLRAYVRRVADTIFHAAGTCAMGRGPMAVVDGRLKVRGLDGLHVADASVMPVVVNCQTYAASVVIAERLAEWLD